MKFAPRITTVPAILLLAAGPAPGQPPNGTTPSIADSIAALKNPDDLRGRESARQSLGPNGPFGKAAVPALIDALAEDNRFTRYNLAAALADHGSVAVPALIDALKRPDARIRAGAADTLGRVRPRPVDAVPALIAALKDAEARVRLAAAWALGQLRAGGDAAIPVLIAGLGDRDDEVRATSAVALGRLVRKPGPAVAALARAVSDPSIEVRIEATAALRQIGPAAREAVPVLIERFGASPIYSATAVLVRPRPGIDRTVFVAAAIGVPALLDVLRDHRRQDYSPRAMAAGALGGIGPAAKEAVPPLIRALRDPDRVIRQAAAYALGRIGPDAAPAVPALIAAAKHPKNPARESAITALGKIGPAAEPAVPLLAGELGADDPFDRMSAAEALGGIGPAARPVVPVLAAIARDRRTNGQLREAAGQAVMKIDPVFAAKEGVEFAHLNIRLGRVPAVQLRPRPAATPEQAKRIKGLIADLAKVENPDFGLSGTLTGGAFAPLPGRGEFRVGLITDHRIATAAPFRELVELGPVALPFLLAALDDRTPTKLTVRSMGMMGFGYGMETNPFNRAENRVPAVAPSADDDDSEDSPETYTVTVGDVCFVAVGQIVGRPYQAVRYIPSAIISINSPTANPLLRDRVRAAWAGDDPAKTLLGSLLIDYAVEGVFNGCSLDGWSEGSRYQVEAAVRLLYYFPDEAAPLIAARLRALNVSKPTADNDWMQREVTNGVRTADFIKAVAWCRAAPVRDALADIAKRTDDSWIKEAVAAAGK